MTRMGENGEFLAIVIGLMLLATAIRVVRFYASQGTAIAEIRRLVGEPYLIAFLRGGAAHATDVALVSLADRGHLDFKKLPGDEGVEILSFADSRRDLVGSELERAILRSARTPTRAAGLYAVDAVFDEARTVRRRLQHLGLLQPDGTTLWNLMVAVYAMGMTLAMAVLLINPQPLGLPRFVVIAICAVAALLLLGLVRLLEHGRPIVMVRRGKQLISRRTHTGLRMREAIAALCEDAKRRVRPAALGGDPRDALLVGATFGLAALPPSTFPLADLLVRDRANERQRERRRRGKDNSGGGSCGSSCGSDSGGDGGGCGGGCGG